MARTAPTVEPDYTEFTIAYMLGLGLADAADQHWTFDNRGLLIRPDLFITAGMVGPDGTYQELVTKIFGDATKWQHPYNEFATGKARAAVEAGCNTDLIGPRRLANRVSPQALALMGGGILTGGVIDPLEFDAPGGLATVTFVAAASGVQGGMDRLFGRTVISIAGSMWLVQQKQLAAASAPRR